MRNVINRLPLLIFIGFFWILFVGCQYDPNRNKLVFKDSTSKVQDAIIAMNNLLDKIPAEKTNYLFDGNNYFIVNNTRLFKVIDNNFAGIDTVSVLKNLTTVEKHKFVSIVIFLRENFISAASKDRIFGFYMYDYRAVSDCEWDDVRIIFYLDKKERLQIESDEIKMKILDRRENIYLVSIIDKKDPY